MDNGYRQLWPEAQNSIARSAEALASLDDVAEMPPDTKERINQLLWCVLPGRTRLAEADAIADQVFALVEAAWEHAELEKTEAAAAKEPA